MLENNNLLLTSRTNCTTWPGRSTLQSHDSDNKPPQFLVSSGVRWHLPCPEQVAEHQLLHWWHCLYDPQALDWAHTTRSPQPESQPHPENNREKNISISYDQRVSCPFGKKDHHHILVVEVNNFRWRATGGMAVVKNRSSVIDLLTDLLSAADFPLVPLHHHRGLYGVRGLHRCWMHTAWVGRKKQTNKKKQYHFKWMLNHTVKLSEDTYKRRAAYHHCGWFVQTVRQAVWTGSSPCCLSLLWWNHSLTLSRFTLRNRRNTQLWLNCGRNKQKSSPLYRLFISSLRLTSTWNLPIYRLNTAQYLNFFFAVFLLFWSSGLHTAL